MATKKAEAAPAATAKAIPWWGKVLVGALGVTLIAKYTPILEIMTMFFYVVMIPLMLLAAIGLVSAGTLEAVSSGWTNTVQEINRRVTEKVKAAA